VKNTWCVAGVAIGAALVLALTGFFGTGANAQAVNKQVIVEAKKIENAEEPFKVKLWTAEGKKNYQVGEKIRFLFSADEDCYLYIIDIGTDGKASVVYPNKHQSANKAEKGKTYVVPGPDSDFVFRVKGPPGTNYLKAIATTKPLESVSSVRKDTEAVFAELGDPVSTFKSIGVELKDKKTWSEAELAIDINE
jgi:hypothetical protein